MIHVRRAFGILLAGACLGCGAAQDPASTGPCQEWTGSLTGNGYLTLALHICGGSHVEGTMQMSGESGMSVRRFVGDWTAGGMTAREPEILRHQYVGDWYHCPVDRYELELAGDRLVGRYVSLACEDQGVLELRRVH